MTDKEKQRAQRFGAYIQVLSGAPPKPQEPQGLRGLSFFRLKGQKKTPNREGLGVKESAPWLFVECLRKRLTAKSRKNNGVYDR